MGFYRLLPTFYCLLFSFFPAGRRILGRAKKKTRARPRAYKSQVGQPAAGDSETNGLRQGRGGRGRAQGFGRAARRRRRRGRGGFGRGGRLPQHGARRARERRDERSEERRVGKECR